MTKSYVKRKDKDLVDVNGNPFTLQGVGIGGWLLIEGYMIKSLKELDRPRRIESFIEKHKSIEFKDNFMRQWREKYFTTKDVEYIKKQGFNSIRIPIDYQFLFLASEENNELESIDQNFKLLDYILDFCEEKQMYVILDLHAAPGGQTGTNIDNSKNDLPELFMNEMYRKQFLFIWNTLAERYKEYQYIAAYDLINEPLPKWQSKYNDMLVALYQETIQTIRDVDSNHMITLEGLHWSTNLTCFTELLDENILVQFHKYWSNPDKESIQEYIDVSDALNVPLFMGEGGENNNKWYSTMFKLYDQLNISYNFWTYKKMDNRNSIVSFEMPTKWQAFLKGELNQEESECALNELLENISFDRSRYNQSVVNHIQRKGAFTSKGFGFDFYGEGISKNSLGKNESSFRKTENIRIASRNNTLIEPNFRKYAGENQLPDEDLFVYLKRNEWVDYTFYRKDTKYVGVIVLPNVETNLVQILINGNRITPTNQGYIYIKEQEKNVLRIIALEDCVIGDIVFQ